MSKLRGEERNLLLDHQILINMKEIVIKQELRFPIPPAGGGLNSALIRGFIFNKSIQMVHIFSLRLRRFTLVLELNLTFSTLGEKVKCWLNRKSAFLHNYTNVCRKSALQTSLTQQALTLVTCATCPTEAARHPPRTGAPS